jgi:hypothetical protein
MHASTLCKNMWAVNCVVRGPYTMCVLARQPRLPTTITEQNAVSVQTDRTNISPCQCGCLAKEGQDRMVYLRGVSGATGVAEGVMQLQGGGWGLTAVWAFRRRQLHGGGVVVSPLACSRLRLLVWFIVGNDDAVVGVYL